MLAEHIRGMLPAKLSTDEAPTPGQQSPLKLSFEVANPLGGVLWLQFSSRPFLFRTEPGQVSLKPGKSAKIEIEIDPGKVTRENYKGLELITAWSMLETQADTGKASTRNGELRIPINVPAPRRPFACPDPKCAQVILSGDRTCRHCGAWLQFCPVCETPALKTAMVCNSLERHPLPRSPDWTMQGGAATRSGVLQRIVRPQATLAWKYAPASPKPPAPVEWSSPAIAYDVVFLAGSVAGVWSNLVALGLATGAELWSLALPENDAVYPYRGGPAVANGIVYVATFSGYVVAVDSRVDRPVGILRRCDAGRAF